jgi:sulfate transport system permease protein
VFAALFNLVFGVVLAWVLVRYRFPMRKLLDAAVDLPFALPTAVAGIALTALYAPNGAFGHIAKDWGFKIAYTQWGILIALIFVGLPFVTRTVQPVIEEIEREVEEASATLGATRAYTLRRVILPMLAPAALTGFALSLARAVGEYGSVIFIAGNIPLKTEIAPLLIVIKLEEYNDAGAAAIGIAMLLISFGMLFIINAVQVISRRKMGHV